MRGDRFVIGNNQSCSAWVREEVRERPSTQKCTVAWVPERDATEAGAGRGD